MHQFDQDLLFLVELGKKIVQASHEPTNSENIDISNAILILMYLEKILDTGRTLLTQEQIANLRLINQGMDSLREDIVRLKDSIDSAEFKRMVDTAGENFKLRFN